MSAWPADATLRL